MVHEKNVVFFLLTVRESREERNWVRIPPQTLTMREGREHVGISWKLDIPETSQEFPVLGSQQSGGFDS